MLKKQSKKAERTSTKKNKWELIESASKEVNTWPQWKRNLSGVESDYQINTPKKVKV